MSSVKAAADSVDGSLTEEVIASPQTHYGKSKRMAEEYILSNIPIG
jgi:UDP-glucose 4-epimerase